MALLEVNQLTKNYARRSGWWGAHEQKCVVDRVSFSIARGETLGLVGESGSGKSTVARMILGLIPPSSGTVSFDGQEVICGAAGATAAHAAAQDAAGVPGPLRGAQPAYDRSPDHR